MAKAGKQSRYPRRKASPSTLLVALLIAFISVAFILLCLRIFSLPSSGKSHSTHDLSSLVPYSAHRGGDRVDRWVEFISWEPRALLHNNFDFQCQASSNEEIHLGLYFLSYFMHVQKSENTLGRYSFLVWFSEC